MTLLYYILTAILASVTTLSAPTLVAYYLRFKTRKQRKLTSLIATEVSKQLKDILND